MKRTHLSIVKNMNIAICITAGLLAALFVSIILTIGLTSMIEKGKISGDGIFGSFLVRSIATVVGGLLSAGLSDKKLLLTIITTSAAYLLILLGIGIILFDGSFCNLWMGVFSVALGAVIALLIKLKPQTNRKKSVRIAR